MPKLKTHKSIAKRVKVKKGKVLKRTAGQGHFNARESGTTTRNKRRMSTVSEANAKNIRTLLPYS